MAKDPLIESLNEINKLSQQATIDLQQLSREIDNLCLMLWQTKMKRIFGPTLGREWITHLPQSWFLMSANRSPGR